MYFIVRPTRREREERLRELTPPASVGRVRGATRTLEEAMEIRRQHEREGEEFKKVYEALDGPEVKQAYEDEMVRSGRDPDTREALPRRSFKTPWEWAKPIK